VLQAESYGAYKGAPRLSLFISVSNARKAQNHHRPVSAASHSREEENPNADR